MDLLRLLPAHRRGGSSPITPERLQEEIGCGQPPVVVDVRRPEDYAAAHLPGAVNLPMERLGEELKRLDKKQPTVFY